MKPPVLHASFLLDGFPNKWMKRRWEVSCRSGTYWTNLAKRRKTLRLRAICRRCCTCNFNCSPPCRLRFPVQIQTLSWRDVSQLSDGHSKCLLRIPNLTLARPLIVNPAIIWTLAVVQLSQSNYRAWAFWVKCCLVPDRRTESRNWRAFELIPSCTISTSWGETRQERFACPTQILKGGFSTIFWTFYQMSSQIVRDLWDALFYFSCKSKKKLPWVFCSSSVSSVKTIYSPGTFSHLTFFHFHCWPDLKFRKSQKVKTVECVFLLRM